MDLRQLAHIERTLQYHLKQRIPPFLAPKSSIFFQQCLVWRRRDNRKEPSPAPRVIALASVEPRSSFVLTCAYFVLHVAHLCRLGA